MYFLNLCLPNSICWSLPFSDVNKTFITLFPPLGLDFFYLDREQHEKSLSKPTKNNDKSVTIYSDIYEKIFRKLGTKYSQFKSVNLGGSRLCARKITYLIEM